MIFQLLFFTVTLTSTTLATKISVFPSSTLEKIPKNYELLNFELRTVFSKCQNKINILAYTDVEPSSLRLNTQKSSFSTFNIEAENFNEGAFTQSFNDHAALCQSKVQSFSDFSSASISESKHVYLLMDSLSDQASFTKFMESSQVNSDNSLVILVHKDHKDPTKPKRPTVDPLFTWLSSGLIVCILVTLLLFMILLVGISWLSAIEGPTRMDYSSNKKQN